MNHFVSATLDRNVATAREQTFEKYLGPYPDQVMNLPNLPTLSKPVLAEISECKVKGFFATVSSGLTSPYHPGDLLLENVTSSITEEGSSTLQRVGEPAAIEKIPDLAGHGFEFVILASQRYESLPHILCHMIRQQLEGSFDYLGRVDEFEAVTSGPYGAHYSEPPRQTTSYLITRFWEFLPETVRLPNGLMNFLTLINIDDVELQFARLNGPHELLARLKRAGVSPTINFDRPAVV